MPQLTEWLKLMLAEIARKRDDAEQARDEDLRRQREDARDGGGNGKTSDTRRSPP
jgi:hypothetical protein